MIASLTGSLQYSTDKSCIIDVSGVGYKVYSTPDTLEYAKTASTVFLFIHTVVREDALELYGFQDQSSLSLFEKLIAISGIGPRAALGVLSVAPVETLLGAIADNNITYLTQISGIGKKTAEKILLELKDKVLPLSENSSVAIKDDNEVMLALLSLGYTQSEARLAMEHISLEAIGTTNKIKEALRNLVK